MTVLHIRGVDGGENVEDRHVDGQNSVEQNGAESPSLGPVSD